MVPHPAAKSRSKHGEKVRGIEPEAASQTSKWWLYAGIVAIFGVAAVLFVNQDEPQDVPKSLAGKAAGEAKLNVFERKAPEVQLMPADAAASHELQAANLIPYVDFLPGPSVMSGSQRPMGARFRNFLNKDLTMWWDNGTGKGVFSGELPAFSASSTNTYTTHTFHFRDKATDELVTSLTMRDDRHLMLLGPDPEDTQTLESKAYQDALKEQEYMQAYYKRTGRPWLAYYPPTPPALPFWPTDFIGQTHKVRSHVGFFSSENEQSQEPVDLNIVVASTHPKVLVIENLLSEFEVQHIIDKGMSVVRRSSVGSGGRGFESDTRTSENGWIKRKSSHVLDTVYYRFGDAMNQSDHLMREGPGGNLEQLQFVKYQTGQKYEPHHDFGNSGKPNQRFSTLFIYLRTPEEGGATSFPKALPKGIKVKPPPGSAVLFYSMDEEGNGDDLSLHSGMVVDAGYKLACNLWSWSPTVD